MSREPSVSEMLDAIGKAADGDCPLDNVEEWLPEHDDHMCPACVGRSAYNDIASTVRIYYNDLMDMKSKK